MIARSMFCQTHRLKLALTAELSADEFEQLSDHLEVCPHCRMELEQLCGGAEWQSRVHECLSGRTASDPFDTSSIDEAVDDDWQAFLSPSDDPTKLGLIGHYEVEELVGRGGFGIVFKAFDPALNRRVAIKILSSPLANSAAARKRFVGEARAAAAVVHDHVVPIHSVDTSGRTPFLVMPFIQGRSLQDRLDDEGFVSVEQVLRIAMQTAQGLAAAHAQGLVHRDIKPANILLENGVERVRISDFGLARTIDDATQTQSGFIAGTPAYMAPEQARGESLDARADLFSLGSVMYAMCTGHPPFRAETTLAVLRRICDDTPRDVRESNPKVPTWLWEIIQKLLAKSANDRFQSANEVAELLERWLAHVQHPTSVAAPKRIPQKRVVSWKVRLAMGIVAGFILFLAGTDVWTRFQNKQRGGNERSFPGATVPSTPPLAPAIGAAPDQIQSEMNALWDATLYLESLHASPPSQPNVSTLDEQLWLLDQQLQRLENELPKATPEPETTPSS